MNAFEQQINNIPHLVEPERDVDRYLRAFSATTAKFDDHDWGKASDLMKDTIRFIADDAFRRGFETCHENVVLRMAETTITKTAAIAALTAYGETVRNALISEFEEAPGAPNQITVTIEDAELPEARI